MTLNSVKNQNVSVRQVFESMLVGNYNHEELLDRFKRAMPFVLFSCQVCVHKQNACPNTNKSINCVNSKLTKLKILPTFYPHKTT